MKKSLLIIIVFAIAGVSSASGIEFDDLGKIKAQNLKSPGNAVVIAEQIQPENSGPRVPVTQEPFAYAGEAEKIFRKKFGKEARISGIRVYPSANSAGYVAEFYLYAPRAVSILCDTMDVGIRTDGTAVGIKIGKLSLLKMGEPVRQNNFKVTLVEARRIAAAQGLDVSGVVVEIFGTTYRFCADKTLDINAETGAVGV